MTEQKAQKAFELQDSRDMLEKLRWELETLFCRQRYDVKVCQYHAINCAITAWHLTDWLWLDIPDTSELKTKPQGNDHKLLTDVQQFQGYVRDDSPALKLCYQIATGSKHCLMSRKPDPTISSVISDGEGYDYGNPVIVEGNTHHSADKVFYEALFWFEKFLQNWNIFPEEPFIPMGDL